MSAIKEGPWCIELNNLGIVLSDGPIEVLIGADIAGKIFTGKRHLLSCGLVAMETYLAWTLMGKASSPPTSSVGMHMTVTSMLTNCCISDLWRLDVLGITDPGEKNTKEEKELAVMDHFMKTVSVNCSKRYEVEMPWIENHPPLPSNSEVAKRRLHSLQIKLQKDGYFNEYNKVLLDWETEGIIEKVPENEISNSGHYLPHQHVVKISSATTKVRPVFDASSKENNQPSLNDCLEKGIILIELIPYVLNRFRLNRIGVAADIKKAFLQISLCCNDKDFLCFLWFDEENNIKIYRHTRVVFGVSCSPFLLGAVIKYHLEKAMKGLNEENSQLYSMSTIIKLLESFYVDNCMASVKNEAELDCFISGATKIMEEAKLSSEAGNTEFESSQEGVHMTPVLGLTWNRRLDTLEINSETLRRVETKEVTKRTILSAAHRVFDPIVGCPKKIEVVFFERIPS